MSHESYICQLVTPIDHESYICELVTPIDLTTLCQHKSTKINHVHYRERKLLIGTHE
uniref:Uncharacterized protein n=1 Tax=Arundo donax TaxID=35708 RepID=A0A0A9E2A4_ARUDO